MLDQLFLQILNMSFTASIVILFVLVARLLLKKAPRFFSYALWSVVLFRLVCPFSFESFFSLLPANANPISQDIVYMQAPKIDTGLTVINNAVNSVLPPATPYASVNPLQIWIFIGSLIWLLGIAVLLVYSLVSLKCLLRHLQNATPYKDNIFISDAIDTAFVTGVFRPQIYLPANLKDAERDYIVLHEQTHIKRLDHIIKLASFLVLCIHWFNPLVWVSFFISGKDMEMTCDEAVIKQLGNDVKKDYSSSLLTLATGRRIVGGTPLAFGEGDTKGRIKNVLSYKKPTFWVALVAVVAVVCVVAGLMTNPKNEEIGFAGVNAIILEIDKGNQTMTVEGIDDNSVIGDKCILTWEGEPFITVATNSGPTRLSLDDFSVGDNIVIFIGEVQESYPTRANATTIQLQPKEMYTYSAENLWNARTKYVGDNSAVGKLIGLLPIPKGLQYDHFELHTSEQPYDIDIHFKTDTETRNFYTGALNQAPFKNNAILLFTLIENVDRVIFTLVDGKNPYSEDYTRAVADHTMGRDVRDYAESPEKLQELLSFTGNAVKAVSAQQGGLTFFVKPDEPAQVIGETAAIIWLKSYMDENTPPVERIEDYKINEVTVISGTPKTGQSWQNMKYHYVVRMNYDITTATDEYFAPGDGVSGKGTFKGLFRELCVKDLGGGNFDILSAGTGGGESEFSEY